MRQSNETCYEYFTDEQFANVCSNEKKIINHILRLKEKYPDDVVIEHTPESNLGVLCAKVPRSWIKKPTPSHKGRTITPEEKEILRKRITSARNMKKNSTTIDENNKDK